MYSLSDCVTHLRRRLPWSVMPVTDEPMGGLVDGVNKRFFVSRVPCTSGITVVDSAGVSQPVTSFDTASGAVVLTAAPASMCYASYTHTQFTDAALAGVCNVAFDRMESYLPRGYYLVNSQVSSDPSTAVDPVCGDTTFSQSRVQTSLLDHLSWIIFLESYHAEASFNAVQVREERAGGLMLSRERQPVAFRDMLVSAMDQLPALLEAAAVESGDEDLIYEGGIIRGPSTDDYMLNQAWSPSTRTVRGSTL